MSFRAAALVRALTALAPAALVACAEPDLGDAPFFCNNGTPQCPDGYVCVEDDDRRVCVRSGIDRRPASAPDQGAVADAGEPSSTDLGVAGPDVAPASDLWPIAPDQGQPTPDQSVPTPDAGIIYPDSGGGGHLGCQSNAECDSDAPCCCPFPLLPDIWTCLPLCFDPFCAG
jgi:hypothetical protein